MLLREHSASPAAELTEELVGARLDAMPELPRTVFLLRHLDGLMAIEIRDIRRVAVNGGGSIRKYNPATREMLDYAYSKGWLVK